MTSLKRSPLTSIENLEIAISSEEIELRELNQPLLPTDQIVSPPPDQTNEEADETVPFPVNEDFDDEIRPTTEDETELRQRRRRRSTSSNRENRRQIDRIRGFARNFWADLLPNDNRNAWRLPILLLVIFLVFLILLITFIALGYTSVNYDEFGVTHNLLTGIMNLKDPYSAGVYIILPWERMVIFDRTARYLNFHDLTVFTTDQASVILDATIVYRIRPNQIEPIWLNFADKHEDIVQLVAENILRNHGNQFSIYDYRAHREHVEYRLSRVLQQTLSGNCCPICCQNQTCSKTIEYSCKNLTHCRNSSETCSNGYFVDVDAVYLFKVALPKEIIKRLYILMLKPIYSEIAESQESAALVWIETERQRNELLNKAREVLMNALASSELVHEKARIEFEKILLRQISSSEKNFFQQLNIENVLDQLSTGFLLELNRLINLTRTVDIENFLWSNEEHRAKLDDKNDLFDFVPASNVFDLTEFLSILDT